MSIGSLFERGPGESDDFSLKVLVFGTFFSLVIHTFIVFLAVTRPMFLRSPDAQDRSIEVSFPKSGLLPVVDSLQEAAKEEPKDPRFASDRNLKAQEETSPMRSPSNIPHAGGGDGGKAQASTKSEGKRIMTLSQADVLKDKSFERETLKSGPKGAASAGFQERLKMGSDLKLNARAFDYGNYINRMRNKLGQRWRPQKTIRTEMYGQQVVRVDIAVILNLDGEIVELYTLEGSRFDAFDNEAIRALREAAPFPNPPKSLIQDDGLVYMPWSFILTMDQWGAMTGGAVE